MTRLQALLRRGAAAAAALALGAAPAGAKRVLYDEDAVIEVACRVRYTTTIVLPADERILDFVAGDTATWQLSGAAHIAYVKPSVEGSETNVTLVAESGRIYFFRVAERADLEPDIRVQVEREAEAELADGAAPDAGGEPHRPMFVGRDEVEAYERAAAEATLRAAGTEEEARRSIEGAVDEFRAEYPTLMRFEYVLERKAGEDPWLIAGMWHDGRSTFVRTLAEEAPALYEQKDGQPSIVNYTLSPDGLYIVGRVLGDGWFQVGRKRAAWRRAVRRLPEVGPPPGTPEPELAAEPAAAGGPNPEPAAAP